MAELAAEKKLAVIGTPIENALVYIGMNVKVPPFDNMKVRQAVAYAMPYRKITMSTGIAAMVQAVAT